MDKYNDVDLMIGIYWTEISNLKIFRSKNALIVRVGTWQTLSHFGLFCCITTGTGQERNLKIL